MTKCVLVWHSEFTFKTCPDGTVNGCDVRQNLYSQEFSYHQSASSLKYHLNTKHLAASSEVRANTACDATMSNHQTTLQQVFICSLAVTDYMNIITL